MLNYYVIDAFSPTPFGGNPAGVVMVDEPMPSEATMQLIAAELRYSETAFIRRLASHHYALRFFTPTSEIPLCGHATLAAFALLHAQGEENGECTCTTQAGTLTIEVGDKVMIQHIPTALGATLDDPAPLYAALGITSEGTALPVQLVSAGPTDIMLPVGDVATLQQIKPDMVAIATLTARWQAVSVHAFVLGNDGYTAHVRDFAPLYGIPEEAATGTANASLTHYLWHHGQIDAPCHCTFMQGEAMGRPSEVYTSLAADGAIAVGGNATIVAAGTLLLHGETLIQKKGGRGE